jgi:hypothetical protein
MVAWAKEHNVPFAAYHYVYPCDSMHPAAKQAETFSSAVGSDKSINCMIDWESDNDDNCHPPGKAQYPAWTDVLAVMGEIRKLGHKVTLVYAPNWYWSEKGKPNMAGVGLDLVQANYGAKPWPTGNPSAIYSVRGGDSGPGWNDYGNLTPVAWQYTCQATWGNMKVDFNAYRGDPSVLKNWFTTWEAQVSDVFPYGYSGNMLTLAQLEAKDTVKKLNPEFWRRFKALMQFALTQKVKLGVGTGWRVQPSTPKPGFAAPGNSNHEGFPADGKTGGAVAIDAVLSESFGWMEKNCKAYGLRTFVQPSTTGYKGSNEPWHVQPSEIPASRNWRKEPWTLKTFQLPGAAPVPPKEVAATPPGNPSFKKGATDASTKIVPGAEGGRVTWLQTILRDEYTISLIPDGQFGSKTDVALRVMQNQLRVKVDGIYGQQTADARYAKVGK